MTTSQPSAAVSSGVGPALLDDEISLASEEGQPTKDTVESLDGDEADEEEEQAPEQEEDKKVTERKRKRTILEPSEALEWTAGSPLYRQEFESAGKVLAMSKLMIDHSQRHGQTRPISNMHVASIVQ